MSNEMTNTRLHKSVRFLAYQQALSLFCGQRLCALDAADAVSDADLDAVERVIRALAGQLVKADEKDPAIKTELSVLGHKMGDRVNLLHSRGF